MKTKPFTTHLGDLLKLKRRSLGIELSDAQIKIVELRRKKGRNLISNWVLESIPQGMVVQGEIVKPQEFVHFLKDLRKKYHLKSRELHLSLNTQQVILRPIQLAQLPEKQLRKVIPIEIKNNMQLPFQEYVYDYVLLPSKQIHENMPPEAAEELPKMEVLLVIAPKSLTTSYMEYFTKAGFRLRSIDLEPLGIFRYLEWNFERHFSEPLFIANIRQDNFEISIFDQRILRVSRTIPFDSTALEEGSYSLIQELERELDRVIHFYQYTLNHRDHPLERGLLVGDVPNLQATSELLSQHTGFKVEVPSHPTNLFTRKKTSETGNLADHIEKLSIPIGLAMKEVRQHGN